MTEQPEPQSVPVPVTNEEFHADMRKLVYSLRLIDFTQPTTAVLGIDESAKLFTEAVEKYCDSEILSNDHDGALIIWNVGFGVMVYMEEYYPNIEPGLWEKTFNAYERLSNSLGMEMALTQMDSPSADKPHNGV